MEDMQVPRVNEQPLSAVVGECFLVNTLNTVS